MKQNENEVLHVLMYLFKNHMHTDCSITLPQEQVVKQLQAAGFSEASVERAFDWLENLAAFSETTTSPQEPQALRVYTELECNYLNVSCRGLIHHLEAQGILNPLTREMVLEQLFELDADSVDLALVKWVILMVLFSQPKENKALSCMEFLVLDEARGGLH